MDMEYATEWAVRDQWDDLSYAQDENNQPRYAIMSKSVESIWMDRYYCADPLSAYELVATLNKPSIPFEPLEKVAEAKLEEILPIVDDLVFMVHHSDLFNMTASMADKMTTLADKLSDHL